MRKKILFVKDIMSVKDTALARKYAKDILSVKDIMFVRVKVQKFDVFLESDGIRNMSDKEKRQIYISFAKIEGGCLF